MTKTESTIFAHLFLLSILHLSLRDLSALHFIRTRLFALSRVQRFALNDSLDRALPTMSRIHSCAPSPQEPCWITQQFGPKCKIIHLHHSMFSLFRKDATPRLKSSLSRARAFISAANDSDSCKDIEYNFVVICLVNIMA